MNPLLDLLNLLGLGGVAVFLYYLYRGLRERIKALAELAEEQQKTLDAVRTRAEEVDRLSGTYKQAVSDFQEIGEKLDHRRKELIEELEAANERKDSELAKLADLQLQEIELKKRSLERLPELEKNLENAVKALGRQVRILVPPSDAQLSLWSRPDTLIRSCDYYPSLLREQTLAGAALNTYVCRLLAEHLKPQPNQPEESGPTTDPKPKRREADDGEERSEGGDPKVST